MRRWPRTACGRDRDRPANLNSKPVPATTTEAAPPTRRRPSRLRDRCSAECQRASGLGRGGAHASQRAKRVCAQPHTLAAGPRSARGRRATRPESVRVLFDSVARPTLGWAPTRAARYSDAAGCCRAAGRRLPGRHRLRFTRPGPRRTGPPRLVGCGEGRVPSLSRCISLSLSLPLTLSLSRVPSRPASLGLKCPDPRLRYVTRVTSTTRGVPVIMSRL